MPTSGDNSSHPVTTLTFPELSLPKRVGWFVCFLVFRGRVSLCCPYCPRTHFVDRVGLKLRELIFLKKIPLFCFCSRCLSVFKFRNKVSLCWPVTHYYRPAPLWPHKKSAYLCLLSAGVKGMQNHVLFETGSCRLALDSWSSCLHLPSSGPCLQRESSNLGKQMLWNYPSKDELYKEKGPCSPRGCGWTTR